jgi:hypothetical protein
VTFRSFCSYTGWFKAPVFLKEVVGEIIWSRGCEKLFSNSPPFPIYDVFTLMSLCSIVIIWRGLHVERSWRYRQLKRRYQTLTVVSVTGLTIPQHMIKEVLKKKYSEVKFKDATKGRICFLPFFNCKQGNQSVCYVKTNWFNFVKLDNHNYKQLFANAINFK